MFEHQPWSVLQEIRAAGYVKSSSFDVLSILGISLHFSFFAKNKENFKIFAQKAKKLRKNKNSNSNSFYAQILRILS